MIEWSKAIQLTQARIRIFNSKFVFTSYSCQSNLWTHTYIAAYNSLYRLYICQKHISGHPLSRIHIFWYKNTRVCIKETKANKCTPVSEICTWEKEWWISLTRHESHSCKGADKLTSHQDVVHRWYHRGQISRRRFVYIDLSLSY